MRNKGFTIIEAMIVSAISLGLMAVVFSVFIVLNTALVKGSSSIDLRGQSQIAMENLQRYLEKSNPEKITIDNCGGQCSGKKITFQVPIISNDAISGTVFSPTHSIKWGSSYIKGNGTYISIYNGYLTYYAGAAGTPDEGNFIRQVWYWKTTGDPGIPCFLAGTPILMADGSTKPIEEIKVGDKVLAYNEKTGKTQNDKVTELFIHDDVEEYLIINGNLKVTPEHRFYNEGKWVNIGSLKVGDKLLDYKGQAQEITSIEKVKEKATVYNFEVEPSHTYFAGGFLVHNRKFIQALADPVFSKIFHELFSSGIAYAGVTKHVKNTKVIATNLESLECDGGADNKKISIGMLFAIEDPQKGRVDLLEQTTIVPRN